MIHIIASSTKLFVFYPFKQRSWPHFPRCLGSYGYCFGWVHWSPISCPVERVGLILSKAVGCQEDLKQRMFPYSADMVLQGHRKKQIRLMMRAPFSFHLYAKKNNQNAEHFMTNVCDKSIRARNIHEGRYAQLILEKPASTCRLLSQAYINPNVVRSSNFLVCTARPP